MDILKFVRDSFRTLIMILLWFILIGCTIGGFIFGGGFINIVGGIIGAVLGLVVGGITIIVVGGYIATILNIDENLEKIIKKMNNLSVEIKKDEEEWD